MRSNHQIKLILELPSCVLWLLNGNSFHCMGAGVFFIGPILVLVLGEKIFDLNLCPVGLMAGRSDGQFSVNWISDSDYSLTRKYKHCSLSSFAFQSFFPNIYSNFILKKYYCWITKLWSKSLLGSKSYFLEGGPKKQFSIPWWDQNGSKYFLKLESWTIIMTILVLRQTFHIRNFLSPPLFWVMTGNFILQEN